MRSSNDGCTWYDYCELAGVPPEPQDPWRVLKNLVNREWYIPLDDLEAACAHYSDLPWTGPLPRKMNAVTRHP